MYPYIHFHGAEMSTYALLAAIGAILVGVLIYRKAMKYKFNDNDIIVLLLITGVGVIIGGHILYGITNIPKIIKMFKIFDQITSPLIFIQCLVEIFGGQVFYGGLIGGLLAGYIYARKKKLDVKLLSFIVAPFIPLFHVFGRIGCFLGGCCYGIESKFGFTYHNALIESANNVSRFPVQLLESGCNLILFIVLFIFQKKEKFKNTLLYVYLMSYGVIRFLTEFLRGDEYRGFVGPLSTSQIISIILFTFGLIMTIKTKKEETKKLKKDNKKKGSK